MSRIAKVIRTKGETIKTNRYMKGLKGISNKFRVPVLSRQVDEMTNKTADLTPRTTATVSDHKLLITTRASESQN